MNLKCVVFQLKNKLTDNLYMDAFSQL